MRNGSWSHSRLLILVSLKKICLFELTSNYFGQIGSRVHNVKRTSFVQTL